jgi:glyceraldehyde-3-phosphate dehydrogenase (NADP+)
LPDIFEKHKASELSSALEQSVLGSLSFNGQRCTALKLFFIPKANADSFAKQLAERVESLSVGLPWQKWPTDDSSSTTYSAVTPLPDQKRITVMKRLIEDAVSKGATIMNRSGGTVVGGSDSTLLIPAVLYPVTEDMEVYNEEQFGPVIPIVAYDSLDTVLEYGRNSVYGQQVSIFTSTGESTTTAELLDQFSTVYGKININSQCGRSPDTLPFSGRRSSAMGVMSVKHSLLEFSIPTVISFKDNDVNAKIMKQVEASSQFLKPV